MDKGLSYTKNWDIGVSYCWNYWPSKFLLHFIEYCLDRLNSKHTKVAVNSAIRYFEGRSQKKCLLKNRSFCSTHHKSFAKLYGNHLLMSNIFKLHKYQTFCLMKMHNMHKVWFANNIANNIARNHPAPLTILDIKTGLY